MHFIYSLIGIIGFASLMAVLTNPFSCLTIVRRPYISEMKQDAIEAVNNNHKLIVRSSLPYRLFGIFKNGFHIIASRYTRRPHANNAQSIDEIIDQIYHLRFNPKRLLLTSGDHFSSLFVRNLGVFYYPTLDTQLATTEQHWHNRQLVYLQTLTYALGVFDKTTDLATTIVPTGRWQATCVDFHSYPSDTLYGMLYALAVLMGKESARPASYNRDVWKLSTVDAAKVLHNTYAASLARHYQHYRERAFDETLGLINPSVTMSGAKDITKRQSSFYDNVVFWKTTQLAMDLGLVKSDSGFLAALKERIITTFWLEDEGYFLEDLSAAGKQHKYYSSDWLIVIATHFLDPEDSIERDYFERSIAYIRKQKIAKPFAIKYQHETRAHRQFAIVRLAVASYGGDSIWSFWGMEYIKTLMLLYRATNNNNYLEEADYHIDKYEHAMKRDRGFPEVYDAKGALLQTPLYRSIRMTGWVIGFDQVRAMRRAITSSED